jgi:hypothetical protein
MRINLSYVGSAPVKIFVKEKSFDDAIQIINEINNTPLSEEE